MDLDKKDGAHDSKSKAAPTKVTKNEKKGVATRRTKIGWIMFTFAIVTLILAIVMLVLTVNSFYVYG